MIQKHDDCRILVIPTHELPKLRRSVDYALTALEKSYGLKPGQSADALGEDEREALAQLKDLRMAVHEDY